MTSIFGISRVVLSARIEKITFLDKSVVLETESEISTLSGELMVSLLKKLMNPVPIEDVIDNLGSHVVHEKAWILLSQFLSKRWIADADHAEDIPIHNQILADISDVDHSGHGLCLIALGEAEIPNDTISDEKSHQVLLLYNDLTDLGDFLFSKNTESCVPVRVTGTKIWIGPRCTSQQDLCSWSEYTIRRNRNAQWKPSFSTSASRKAAVLLSIRNEKHISDEKMLQFDLETGETSEHYVWQKIQKPFEKNHITKLLDDLTGLISPPKIYFSVPDLIYISQASLPIYDRGHLGTNHPKNTAAGKGQTEIEAKEKCFYEAVERYSALKFDTKGLVFAKASDLEFPAFLPNYLAQFSEQQFQNRDSWNVEHEMTYQYVPRPFDELTSIYWQRVENVVNEAPIFVPAVQSHFPMHPDLKIGIDFRADSNGLAAGQSLHEAIFSGIMELIERDAIALWWYNRLRVPEIPLANIDSPWITRAMAYLSSLGRETWFLDLTTDVGIPVSAAISHKAGREIVFGFAAGVNRKETCEKALMELFQILPAIHKNEDGVIEILYSDPTAKRWFLDAEVEKEEYLLPFGNVNNARSRNNLTWKPSSRSELKEWSSRFPHEIFFLDHTKKDLGIPVAKVFIPELRHFWRRLAPGRLFTYPMTSGHFNAPKTELEMNEWSFFL